MSAPETGTVVHGTLREPDLAVAFLAALERIAPHYIGTDWHRDMVADVQRIVDADGDLESGYDIILRLEDEINACLPYGYRFGAHEGDGADFGIWEVDDDE